MDVEVCSNCHAPVVPTADGTCPSCRVTFVAASMDELRAAKVVDATAGVKKQSANVGLILTGLAVHVAVFFGGLLVLIRVVPLQMELFEELRLLLSQPVQAVVMLTEIVLRYGYLLLLIFIVSDVVILVAARKRRRFIISWVVGVVVVIALLVGASLFVVVGYEKNAPRSPYSESSGKGRARRAGCVARGHTDPPSGEWRPSRS